MFIDEPLRSERARSDRQMVNGNAPASKRTL